MEILGNPKHKLADNSPIFSVPPRHTMLEQKEEKKNGVSVPSGVNSANSAANLDFALQGASQQKVDIIIFCCHVPRSVNEHKS